MSHAIDMTFSETARAAALARYAVLDTQKEEEFDDLASIASEVCEVPIAIVNLIDTKRQFFKAEVGIGARETPLETSFCRHALLLEEMMIVPDATKDPRFEGNPLVMDEPKLRFYAGALIRTPEGYPIGTVCVLDTKPRTLNEHQIRTLKLLARQAMTQLELRRTLAERESALVQASRLEDELRLAVQQQNEISREMAHRMKNLLSMVQAIIAQTLRQTNSLEKGRETISQRVAALSRAQDALLETGANSVDIQHLTEVALAPHRTGEGRFFLAGPSFQLTAQQSLGLSLGLHELATNAAKYGALSGEEGRVEVRWSNENGRFEFVWTEIGGPQVAEPERKGFGSKLLERIVANYFAGTSALEYNASGVVFRLQSEL